MSLWARLGVIAPAGEENKQGAQSALLLLHIAHLHQPTAAALVRILQCSKREYAASGKHILTSIIVLHTAVLHRVLCAAPSYIYRGSWAPAAADSLVRGREPSWDNTLHFLSGQFYFNKYILWVGQIFVVLSTNTLCDLYKYILCFRQIHYVILRNTKLKFIFKLFELGQAKRPFNAPVNHLQLFSRDFLVSPVFQTFPEL